MSARAEFGERLRRHRERCGVSIPVIAQETKIGSRFFSALERGDCKGWPGGLYSRAFVRSYAAAVGLDPEELVAEFIQHFPEIALPLCSLWPEAQPETGPGDHGGSGPGNSLGVGKPARSPA